ncbi:U32 family peptidase [Anaerosphaera multitolerans]|uniref:U32 family peptidase n=1 Tax=Anaerosphaera multitolerans TaxID=2487351 RepID=A0A437S6Z1_9FIRM|nr:U32 family peptidase [Anaerosphaera multitolerans]RVU54751.1 U32 family peptidase [Anaerosphaera multitolerans]
MNENSYEILAPAGDFESLKAGITAGCNAVYLGGKNFGARAKAKNFSDEDLKRAVDFAHLRKVKIYVTMNILLEDSEVKEAIDFTNYLYEIGVDGIIVQDLGFGILAKSIFKNFDIHASTQMAINNFYGAKAVENLGFNRVVLARETELDEINKIKENTNIEIEGFVHGALCVCFSGECLMSSMIGGRSGNRGECAQPCRKEYGILNLKKDLISEEKYILSPKDLNTLLTVDDYVKRGVYSLKIEGRMKKPQYVYQIVSSYKKALEENLNKVDLENTEQIFNRGFTKGLFNGDFGRAFISYDRPDNRGILVGEVLKKVKDGYILNFTYPIEGGDGLEIFSKEKSFGFNSNFNTEGKYIFKTNKNLAVGSRIYKTYSKELSDNIERDLNSEPKYRTIDIKGNFKLGEKPNIRVSSEDIEVEVFSNAIVEEAKKAPLTEEKIKENLSKLGDSVYKLNSIEINSDDNIFLPISILNSLRREAIEKLNNIFISVDRETITINDSDFNINREPGEKEVGIRVEIYNLSSLKELETSKVKGIYIPIKVFTAEITDYLRANDLKVSVVLRKFQNSTELEEDFNFINNHLDIIDEILINNIGQVEKFKNLKIRKVADIGLNIFNSFSVKFLLEQNFNRIILSPEVNSSQIRTIAKNYGDVIEVLAHGLVPVMTMKHCPASIVKNCSSDVDCRNCNFEKGFYIRDKRNVDFLVERYNGVSEIFNPYPIVLIDKLQKLKNYGVSSFKLNLREDINFTSSLYKEAIERKDVDSSQLKEMLIKKYENITYGHYNRGILNG